MIDKIFSSKIINKDLLCKSSSTKQSYLISLDTTNLNIDFSPGDSIGIFPQNDPEIVNLTINYMKANKNDLIIDPKTKEQMTLENFLTKNANISKVPNSLIQLLDPNLSKDKIHFLSQNHHLWDLLKKFPNHNLSKETICSKLLKLLPRLYSIASYKKTYPNELHLLITHISYDLSNIKRTGVCTDFLCKKAHINKTPITFYHHKSSFKLPQKDVSIIMIGAGSGIAPFIGFLQKRYEDKTSSKNYLFFGERNKKTDFYFQDFLEDLTQKNFLKLSLAFSRDQDYKIYVQDRLYEQKKQISTEIQNGAYIYVCGDAKKMAKDVDDTLHKIIKEENNYSDKQNLEFFKNLRKEKRYLREIY